LAIGHLVNERKASLRVELRRARNALAEADRKRETTQTVATLQALLTELGHPPLASYMAVRGELDLAMLHDREWSAGRPIWLPRVQGHLLSWHPVREPGQLWLGSFGIQEPDPARIPEAPLPVDVVVLIPGLGFAANGLRLGQGAGYYDRMLGGISGLTIGVGFVCQRRDDLPHEAHDQVLRAVLLGGAWVRPPGGPGR
jgi:5-formyltetrahydrofolate cyclo-ligase